MAAMTTPHTDLPYTPGPWQWVGSILLPVDPDPERSAVYTILSREGGCGFVGKPTSEVVDELAADDLLIAAAPQMYELLCKLADLAGLRVEVSALIKRIWS